MKLNEFEINKIYHVCIKENEKLKKDLVFEKEKTKSLDEHVKQLQEENKLLRECVEFYADENNYVKKQYNLDPTLLEKPEFLNGWHVGGKLARKTLTKIKGDENG